MASANIEVSCILQSKRQQPIRRSRLKRELYANFTDEQKAEIINGEVKHRTVATVRHLP